MTVPPLPPRSPRPRRRWRLGAVSLAAACLAVVIVAAGGYALLSRRSETPAGVTGASPAASAAAASSAAASSSSRPSAPATAAASVPARPQLVSDPQPVPIIVYHHVVAKPDGPALTWISVRLFRAQMAWLARHGYEAVTLRRVYDAWTGKATLPTHPVVLTFDDGYADQVRNAAPVLRRYHWPAELALATDALDLSADPPASRLTPKMVRRLLADGWELESHTVSHADVTRLWGAKLRHQLVDSRAKIERLFGVQVDFFCYPGGLYNKRVKLAVRRAGYLAATGTRYGAALPNDLFSLPRIYAYRGESMRTFASRLREILAAAD